MIKKATISVFILLASFSVSVLANSGSSKAISAKFELLTAQVSDTVSISELRENDDAGMPVFKDSVVTVSGVVTVGDELGTAGPAYIEDGTGGIAMYGADLITGLAIGDSITITSPVGFYNGLSQLLYDADTTEVTVHKSGLDVWPTWVTIDDILTQEWDGVEELEGMLVTLEEVQILTEDTEFESGTYEVTDGVDTMAIYIDSATDLEGTHIKKTIVSITGVIGQYDSSSPYSEGYQVIPRFVEDIESPSYMYVDIEDLRENDETGTPVLLDSIITTYGVVTVADEFGSTGPAYIQNEYAGVAVYGAEFMSMFKVGDVIEITSPVGFFRGLTEIIYDEDVSEVFVSDSGFTFEPPIATIEDILTQEWDGYEALEGQLVTLEDVMIITEDEDPLFDSGTYEITDGTDTLAMYIDSDTDLMDTLVVKGMVDITGIIGQYDYSSPYSEGYQLLPRTYSDIRVSYPDVDIDDIRVNDETGTPVMLDSIVTTYGVVTVTDEFGGAGPAYIQNETAGVAVYGAEFMDMFEVGDLIEITSPVGFFRGLTELMYDEGVSHVRVWESDFEFDPAVVTISDILNQEWDGFEALEGQLVTLEDVMIVTEDSLFDDGTYDVTDGVDTLALYIDSATDLMDTLVVHGMVDITGIVGQYDSSEPYSEGYQLLPRTYNDIQEVVIYPFKDIADLRENDEDGSPVLLDSIVTISGVVSVADELGSAGPAYVQDRTGGVAVYGYDYLHGEEEGEVLMIGDSVTITGPVGFFNGLTEVVYDDEVSELELHKRGLKVGPVLASVAAILGQEWSGYEAIEGLLVKIEKVEILTDDETFSSGTYEVTNGVDTLVIYIDSATELIDTTITKGKVDIVGVVGQYDGDAPYSTGYQLLPRFFDDITEAGPDVANELEETPRVFALSQNYPNPFNPSTNINFELPTMSNVEITIYNAIGQTVEKVSLGARSVGVHNFTWNASSYASGMYLYRISAKASSGETFTATKKMLLIK